MQGFCTKNCASEDECETILIENSELIIKSFNGWNNIIQLCLTHPNSKNIIQQEYFLQLN